MEKAPTEITVEKHDYKTEIPAETWGMLSRKDKSNAIMLIVLYFLQGIAVFLLAIV